MRSEQLELFSKQKIEDIKTLRGSELINYFFDLVDNISSNNEIEITENNILDISDDNKKIEVLQSIYENLETLDDKKAFYEIIVSKENVLGTKIIDEFKEYISDKEKKTEDIEIPKLFESNTVDSKQTERELSIAESFEPEVLLSNIFESKSVGNEIPQVETTQKEVIESNVLEQQMVKPEMSKVEVTQHEVFESNPNEIVDKFEKELKTIVQNNKEESQNLQAEFNSKFKEIDEKQIQQKQESMNDLKGKVEKLRNEYKLMLSDGYIDNVELDNIILEINKLNNDIEKLGIMLSNPKEKVIISSTIFMIEEEINKLESIKNERIKTFKEREQKNQMINNDLQNLKMYISEYNGKFKYIPMANRSDMAQAEANEILWAIDEIVNKNANNAEVMLEAIKFDASYIKNAGEELANNTDFIMKASSVNSDISNYLINQEVLEQNNFKTL